MRIAIIGTGISGLSAAWLLNQAHEITVYEKEARPGGHSNTVTVDYDGRAIPVDTGFIVFNDWTYPNLVALFDQLGVATELSNMSFSVSARRAAFEWSGDSLRTIFAQKRNLVSPSFLRMLSDILRFYGRAGRDLRSGALEGLTLGEYIVQRGFGHGFQRDYILPMGAAIWSTPMEDMLNVPAESFIAFFENHKLLQATPPDWRTVSGGSQEYVKKLTAPFQDKIRLSTPAARVERTVNGVLVTDGQGHTDRFDHVVMACHSDQALKILHGDADARERTILGALRYTPNTAFLHRDPALMPRNRKVWASWNYISGRTRSGSGERDGDVSVSYWMNLLQNIDKRFPLYVSLNPLQEPTPELTFASFAYDHPLLDTAARKAQLEIDDIQGVRNTWFCGAYCGHGFHEDGLRAGLDVAERLGGLRRPWAVDAPRGLEAAE